MRQDHWANKVTARLSGVIDMPAADAQYHVHCYNHFRVVPVTRPSIMAPMEEALRSLVSKMAENATDVDDIGAVLHVSRRQLVSSLTAHLGDELLVLHIEGCDSVVGFKASLRKFIKIVKISKSKGDDDELEKLVRKIRSEVMATPRPGDYNLSAHARHKVIESTSVTLLKLVSSLVSGGAITKPPLTLAQCIQQHIGDAGRNQTTLGLAVKLHHARQAYTAGAHVPARRAER